MAGLADLDRGHVWVAGVLSPLADSEGLVAWNSSGVLPVTAELCRRTMPNQPTRLQLGTAKSFGRSIAGYSQSCSLTSVVMAKGCDGRPTARPQRGRVLQQVATCEVPEQRRGE